MIVAGIDVGIYKADVSIFDNRKLTALKNITVSGTFNRSTQLRELAKRVASYTDVADHVFIEQNLVGNNVKYSINLAQSVGAIAAEFTCPVDFVNVSSWKKVIVGKGNAKKEDVRSYIDSAFPQYTAWCDGSQDKYDAICIGLYGVHLVDLAEDLASELATGRSVHRADWS